MVFLDTSAVVAVLAGEPDAASFAAKLEAEPERISAGHVLLEASTRLASLLGLTPTVADGLVTRLFREADVDIVPITEEVAQIAVAAFERYGKGRGAVANLNLGDCLSYACAKAHDARLLFKGSDFSQTDIARA
ncbi:MAG: type II toxin-antitoxin system VapC family toxin [Xanthobacteraceae bacterium]|jgi:ribonuclease VapC